MGLVALTLLSTCCAVRLVVCDEWEILLKTPDVDELFLDSAG